MPSLSSRHSSRSASVHLEMLQSSQKSMPFMALHLCPVFCWKACLFLPSTPTPKSLEQISRWKSLLEEVFWKVWLGFQVGGKAWFLYTPIVIQFSPELLCASLPVAMDVAYLSASSLDQWFPESSDCPWNKKILSSPFTHVSYTYKWNILIGTCVFGLYLYWYCMSNIKHVQWNDEKR